MTEKLNNELVQLITDKIEVAVRERFKATNRKIEIMQKCLDTLSGDLDIDRGNLSQMAIDTAALLQQGKELLASVQNMRKRITEEVTDQAQEVMEDTVNKVTQKVEPVMNEAVKKLNKGLPLLKYPWWKFWMK